MMSWGLLACSAFALPQDTDVRTLMVGEQERIARVAHGGPAAGRAGDGSGAAPTSEQSTAHRPALLLVFHGGAGNARRAQRGFGFDRLRLGEDQDVLIVYPEGLDGHWNDGRGGKRFAEQDAQVDDVAFVLALLDLLEAEGAYDPRRAYAVGASNGGMFVQRLVAEHPERFAAAAVLIANLPAKLERVLLNGAGDGVRSEPGSAPAPASPGRPVLMFMNGTEDPLMPFMGGEVTVDLFPRLGGRPESQGRGKVLSTARTMEVWAQAMQLDGPPEIEALEESDTGDGTRIRVHRWASSDGSGGDALVLWEIVGGGHTFPGGKSSLSERIVGRTSREADAVDVVWSFLREKQRP